MRTHASMTTRALLLVCCLSSLVGCARLPGLYFDLGAGVKLDQGTSAVLMPFCKHAFGVTGDPGAVKYGRGCGGRNPTGHFSLGWEFKRGSHCEISHFSHVRDGFPFNDHPETFKQEIECERRWGGRQRAGLRGFPSRE